MEATQKKPFSFLQPPDTFQDDPLQVSGSRPSQQNYDFRASSGANYIDSFRLTPSLIKPQNSPLRGPKLNEADLVKSAKENFAHVPAQFRRGSPLRGSQIAPMTLHFQSMRPYSPQDEHPVHMTRQENKEFLQKLEVEGPSPMGKKLEEFTRHASLREPQTTRVDYRHYSRKHNYRPEVSPRQEKSQSPRKGTLPRQPLRVERITPHKASPRKQASQSPVSHPLRGAYQKDTSAAGLALGHLEERLSRLEAENEMLRGQVDHYKHNMERMEDDRTTERKEWDAKFVQEVEQSLKRESQIKQRCNYTNQEMDHLRNLRNEAQNEKLRIEGLYKIVLEEKAAKEQEAKITVQKLDRTLKELSEMLEKEKDAGYDKEKKIRELQLELEEKSALIDRLNANLGSINYENQLEAEQINAKYKELQHEHGLLKNEIEAYQLRAQNRIAEQAQQINTLENELKQSTGATELANLKVRWNLQKRCEHERDQYRDEVLRSWNQIKRLQSLLSTTEDELHQRRGDQARPDRLARSIGPSRRKSLSNYMSPTNYRGHPQDERSPSAGRSGYGFQR